MRYSFGQGVEKTSIESGLISSFQQLCQSIMIVMEVGMKRITYSILTVVASLIMVSPLSARENGFTHQARGTSFNQNTELDNNNTSSIKPEVVTRQLVRAEGLPRTESAADILGMPVVGQDGAHVGKIQDMRVDNRTGRIDYLIVKQDNAMGVGEAKYVAVPLGAIQFTDNDARLTVDRSRLENVPSYTSTTSDQYINDLNAHYGIAPPYQEERRVIHHEESTTVKP
jgi:sporulation protein YlmC with PRC-barrel domain